MNSLSSEPCDGLSVDAEEVISLPQAGTLRGTLCRNLDDAYPFVRPSKMRVDSTLPGGRSTAHQPEYSKDTQGNDQSRQGNVDIHIWELQELHVRHVCVPATACGASLNVDTLTSFCTIIVTVQPLAAGESRIASTDVQARHL